MIFRSRILLKTGHDYRFRYLLNGERWKNDWAAIHDRHKYSNKYSTIEQIDNLDVLYKEDDGKLQKLLFGVRAALGAQL